MQQRPALTPDLGDPARAIVMTLAEIENGVETGVTIRSGRGTYFASAMESMWTLLLSASALAVMVTLLPR